MLNPCAQLFDNRVSTIPINFHPVAPDEIFHEMIHAVRESNVRRPSTQTDFLELVDQREQLATGFGREVKAVLFEIVLKSVYLEHL